MDELSGRYYFRLTVLDQPGVLATVAGVLSKYEISIESVIQKGRKKVGAVPLVIVTHHARTGGAWRPGGDRSAGERHRTGGQDSYFG